MKTQIKNFGKAGVCFFLMSGMVHAQTTKKDSLNEKKIEEVVVVGYKKQRKETLTSSVATVNSEQLQDVTSANFQTMLQGKMPGVVAAVSSGQPGSKPTMRIRGIASISANNDPLYVVDGVIVHGNADIAPDQIEDVTVLKDAAATALYGSRGAAGVIVITTKAGKGNSINVRMNNSFNFFNMGPLKIMNSQQLKDHFMEYLDNNPNLKLFGADGVLSQQYGKTLNSWDDIKNDFNWKDLATQVGVVHNYDVSFNKSSEGSKTYLNAGYYNEEGTIKGYKLERLTVRLNHETQLYKWLKVSPKLYFMYDKTFDQQYSLFDGFYKLPWDSPYNPDGSLYYVTSSNNASWFSRDRGNYLIDRDKSYSKANTFNAQGNLDFEVKLMKNLKFISTNSLTYYNYDGFSYNDPSMLSEVITGGRMSQSNAIRWTSYTNQMLRYENTWNDKHRLNALVAYEYQDYMYKANGARVKNIIVGSEVLSNSAEADGVPTGQRNEYAFQSYLSNAEYSYDDKYLLQGSVRVDQSSRFTSQNKTGVFWAVSTGWNVANERFFQSLKSTINKWKVRGSYGAQGNAPTNYYATYNKSTSVPYNGNIGLYPTQAGNNNLKWETIYQLDLGTDISFLNNRINIVFDWYNKDTKDLITSLQLPWITGFNSKTVNIGTIRNRGIELAIDADIIRNSNVRWNVGFNIAKNKATYVDLYNGSYKSGMYRVAVGEKMYTYELREWAGVDASNGNPLWNVYFDSAGKRIANLTDYMNANPGASVTSKTTNNYDQATYVHLKDKSRLPDFTGGFNTSVSYKGFTLAASAYFSVGGYLYNGQRSSFLDADGTYPYYNVMVPDKDWIRWSPKNTPEQNAKATHPSLIYEDTRKGRYESTRYLEKGDFLKIRSISLSYDVPKSFIPGNTFKSARISVNAENMFMITGYSGQTPEMDFLGSNSGGDGFAYTGYPAPRTITVGLNVSF